jgi:hypothetical protein
MKLLIIFIVIAAILAIQVLITSSSNFDKAGDEYFIDDFVFNNNDLILKNKLIDQILRNLKAKQLINIFTRKKNSKKPLKWNT